MNILTLNLRDVNLIYTNITLAFAIVIGIVLGQADKQTFIGIALLITFIWVVFLGAWIYNSYKDN